jgi:hypothetical protein
MLQICPVFVFALPTGHAEQVCSDDIVLVFGSSHATAALFGPAALQKYICICICIHFRGEFS